uniref:Uncharacterized protein n=1 Tax=Anopheles albimanus TaxID=7167 RepID=A0A182FWG0_ANOAL
MCSLWCAVVLSLVWPVLPSVTHNGSS